MHAKQKLLIQLLMQNTHPLSGQFLADTLEVSSDYLLARTDVKRTATFSGVSESDLAARVARIENHLGLN